MTDSATCNAVYKSKSKVELGAGAFTISYRGRGGVSGVTVRFGNEPAQPLRLATETEKEMSMVIFEGEDLAKVLSASRLRVEVLTVLDTSGFDDIDLSDITRVNRAVLECNKSQHR